MENPTTAKSIADTAQCTESTLKNAYRLLLEEEGDLLAVLNIKNSS
jgi:transcription initiation factor TFIIIB Brf1 subunit/transcription initiation factor TFIIB